MLYGGIANNELGHAWDKSASGIDCGFCGRCGISINDYYQQQKQKQWQRQKLKTIDGGAELPPSNE